MPGIIEGIRLYPLHKERGMMRSLNCCSQKAQNQAETLVREYPEVMAATRMRNFGYPVFRYGDKVFSEEKVF